MWPDNFVLPVIFFIYISVFVLNKLYCTMFFIKDLANIQHTNRCSSRSRSSDQRAPPLSSFVRPRPQFLTSQHHQNRLDKSTPRQRKALDSMSIILRAMQIDLQRVSREFALTLVSAHPSLYVGLKESSKVCSTMHC